MVIHFKRELVIIDTASTAVNQKGGGSKMDVCTDFGVELVQEGKKVKLSSTNQINCL